MSRSVADGFPPHGHRPAAAVAAIAIVVLLVSGGAISQIDAARKKDASPRCFGQRATIVGASVIQGTAGNDVIVGSSATTFRPQASLVVPAATTSSATASARRTSPRSRGETAGTAATVGPASTRPRTPARPRPESRRGSPCGEVRARDYGSVALPGRGPTERSILWGAGAAWHA